jgi:hypothetical protein
MNNTREDDMGKSYTPTYRIEFWDCKGVKAQQAWRGKATKKALAEWVWAYDDSLKVGGVNFHVSQMLKYIPFVSKAIIVRQADNTIMTAWTMPMFQVI